ncbi:MAG: acetamidase/formamidase family protein [Lagierella massiliensis]|nr:acetamidase/formamidase family protein [Lagierella massiliensis]
MQKVKSDKVIYTFKTDLKEVATVKEHEEFIVETNDCFYQQIQREDQVIEEIDQSSLNPATGPIYVEGAQKGDLLKVNIKKIEVSEKGCSLAIPGFGVLGDKKMKATTKVIEVFNSLAHFSEDIKIPIKPMIGVIGVAPFEEDGSHNTDTPFKHGGNMDTTEIGENTTLYFPVAVDGAMLALGDLHAVMGDGEVSGTGLEIPGEVTLEVEVIKNKTFNWPILETKDEIIVLSSGDSMEQATKYALESIIDILKNSLNISWEESYILSSLAVDLRISQLVDPKITIRSAISKEILSIDKVIENL